jgi:fatty-acyl-CoA synthase
VSEVAVIGVKDDKWGERPLALVVRDAQTGDDLSDTRIKAQLNAFAAAGVISKFGIPDKILFVKALPRTSVGKFDKKELRQKYGKSGVPAHPPF